MWLPVVAPKGRARTEADHADRKPSVELDSAEETSGRYNSLRVIDSTSPALHASASGLPRRGQRLLAHAANVRISISLDNA
jgi:hypothetical protein